MHQQAMQGMPLHMLVLWIVLGGMAITLMWFVFLMTRRATNTDLSLSSLAARRHVDGKLPSNSAIRSISEATDTVFLLPDISNYTSFMTGSQFSFGHAQHIIFSLVNAMIGAATSKIELSKLEGDAALFFVDAGRYSKTELGELVIGIFRAFFKERKRLKKSNICPCRACTHIDELDLKIFVHRGQAAQFQFRGATDLFGTDVIVLHRIMKNGVNGHRYAMVTDAAADCIELPGTFDISTIVEDVEHVGKIAATIYKIDDASVEQLADDDTTERYSIISETISKLRENVRLTT